MLKSDISVKYIKWIIIITTINNKKDSEDVLRV